MRKSDVFFVFIGVMLLLAGLALFHSQLTMDSAMRSIAIQAKMVEELELTDLCLFTEAQYTRNPSQADRFTPFQDHPMSLEHFPTGSIVGPPARLRSRAYEPH